MFRANAADFGGGMGNAFGGNPTVTNCTFSGNSANSGDGMFNEFSSSPTVTNCILWGDSPNEIFNDNADFDNPNVSFSDVQGGLSAGSIDGGGNINADPLFVDADGADNVVGTLDDDLRLQDASPRIDAGDNTALGLVGILIDLDGNDRFIDAPGVVDTGFGTPPIVDMGPYENAGAPDSPTVGDDLCNGGSNDGGSCSTDADCPSGTCGNKSRYITIAAPVGSPDDLAIQVTIASMPLDPARVGEIWWAGASESIANAPNPTLAGAQVLCEAAPSNAEVWPVGNVHLFGEPIVPGASYEVRMCDATGASCSDPLLVATGKWGDVVAPYGGGGQPDFVDISAVVDKFSTSASAPDMSRADLRGGGDPGVPNSADGTVDFTDIAADVDAFSSVAYPFTVAACP